jgi:hypothetical protein
MIVEIAEAGDDDQRGRHAVGDLNEIAHSLLEALIGVGEEAQIFDLVDAEDERRAIDRPHELAETFDDLEGAALTRTRIERGNRRLRELIERATMQILAHALVDARVGSLQIEQRAHDVDVEFLVGEGRARDDFIGKRNDQLGELILLELGLRQLIELLVAERSGRELVGQPRKAALAFAIGIVRFFERGNETAQVVVGVARDVGRHLRVTEVRRACAMAARAECTNEMRLTGTGLAMEEQHSRGRHGPVDLYDRVERALEFRARLLVHGGDVHRIRAPDIVFPGDRVLER